MLRAPLLLILAIGSFAQQASLDEAAAAFEHGNLAEAEQHVASFLKDHAGDLRALVLMGVILDAEKRYQDAEQYYGRALKLAPGSAQLLNNVGNHYLSTGDRKRAREFYVKAVAVDAHHPNANLQLAQISVDERLGSEALKYLSALPGESASDPSIVTLRARALALSGKCSEASQLIQPGNDPRLNFSNGLALAECKFYGEAEKSFSRALDADPRNFDILYNLGLAALRAGDFERALAVLQVALKERPDDPDCLYATAQALLKAKRPLDAAALLAKAPQRADILLLLAQVSAQLEFYEDSAAAYDGYLRQRPHDDAARRERGFAFACAGQSEKALGDLEWYAHKHPSDARGLYELAVAQQLRQKDLALITLNHALALDPKLIEARYARAVLNLAGNRPAAAIEDLRPVLEREPENPRVLARLGQAYLDLHRAQEAAGVLKRAVELSPDAPFVLLQYRRALIGLGQTQEAAAILARIKQPANNPKRQPGLVEFFNLPAPDQRARYLANLRQGVADHPDDPRLKLRLAQELLADGKTGEAQVAFREFQQSTDPKLLADAGRILLDAGDYAMASEFLEAAIAADPSMSAVRLDLAAALFRVKGPEAALAELDKTRPETRKGDYYLLRAQLFDATGNLKEAVNALNRGMQASPTRATLYLQSAGFLLKHQLYKEALALLEQASRLLPENRELLLARAVTLAVLRRDDDARSLLAQIQSSWPEWDRPYLLNGIMLEIQLRSAEARPLLETAIALGAQTPEAYYYQALAITHAAPDDFESARRAVAQALQLAPKDPYILLLAGKISLDHKEYAGAIEQLQQAIEVSPTLIPARYALRHAYQATGDEAKAAAEMAAIQRIAAETAASENNPFPVDDFVFTVR